MTRYSSHLTRSGEPGALDESFSDAMGEAAENALEVDDPVRNFVVGELITKDGRGMRDMQNPTRLGHPDHYENLVTCAVQPGDGCSVHANAGIPNRAFSLMTVGGTHLRHDVGVTGIGWQATRELWYSTFTKLSPDADFRTAALAQISEASSKSLDMLRGVGCAWYAVGVIKQDVHPLLAAVTCSAASVPGGGGTMVRAKGPNCDNRLGGWACSDNVKSQALQCKNGFTLTAVTCADPDQLCKKAAIDDWTASVDHNGVLSCE